MRILKNIVAASAYRFSHLLMVQFIDGPFCRSPILDEPVSREYNLYIKAQDGSRNNMKPMKQNRQISRRLFWLGISVLLIIVPVFPPLRLFVREFAANGITTNTERNLTQGSELIVSSSGSQNESAPTESNQNSSSAIVYGTSILVEFFDPHHSPQPIALSTQHVVYDALVRITPYDEILPMLANSWSYNEDLTELTLNLRRDVIFHNGTLFNATVAKQNLDYALNQGHPAVQQDLETFKSVDIVDDYTIRLNLYRPDLAALTRLGGRGGTMIEPSTLGLKSDNVNPIGTGPFMINVGESDPSIPHWVFEANVNYWDENSVQIERFESIGFRDGASRINALLNRELDSMYVLPTDIPAIEHVANLHMAQAPGFVGGVQIIDTGGIHVPQMANKEIRCAIAQSIDRDYYAEEYEYGLSMPEAQLVSPGQYAYSSASLALHYDLVEAKAVIDHYGSFEITTGAVPGGFTMTQLNYLQLALAEIGITVNIEEIKQENVLPSIVNARYPLQVAPFVFDHPIQMIEQRGLVGSYYNPSGFLPTGVDELYLQIAKGQLPAAETETIITQIMARMFEECVWIPISIGNSTIAFHDTIENVQPTNAVGGIEVRGLKISAQ